MPWSAGTYTLPRDMTDDDSAGIPIVASNFDEQFEDIRDGINLTLTKDGQNEPTANLPMGTFRHTDVGLGVAATDYPRIDQVQKAEFQFGRATGAGAYIVNLSPSANLADGMVVTFVTSAVNSAGNPTLQISTSASAKIITYRDSAAIGAGDMTAGLWTVTYDVSADNFRLANLAIGTASIPGLLGVATTAEMSAGGAFQAAVGSSAHGAIIVIESSVTATGFSATDVTVDYKLSRHGRNVIFDLQAVSRSDGVGTTMGLTSTLIPAGMRPQGTKVFIVRVGQATAAFDSGLMFVTQAGQVGFNKTVIGSAFSAGNTGRGWDNISVCWTQAN